MSVINSSIPNTKANYNIGNTNFRNNHVSKDPKQVGADFESFVFYRPMFKMMREDQFATKEDPFFNSDEMKNIQEMRDEVIADYLGAQGKLGMIKLLEESAYISEQKNTAEAV
ncbi:MAG: hypothetical protein K0S74_518 [Chlamydiales bacterium]|jgi:Rod binding domain-containing protein|nr:hypothetical protein [Chlamydiales bacterium]